MRKFSGAPVRKDHPTKSAFAHMTFPDLLEKYSPRPHPLKFMSTVKYRVGYGAARKNLQRMIDRRGYDMTMMHRGAKPAPNTRDGTGYGVYPASLFKGRPKVKWELRKCQSCNCEYWAFRADRIRCNKCRNR